MKVLTCQNNTTPGGFEQIKDGILKGNCDDLIVFPELSIPGYLCKDMMFRKGFVEDNLRILQAVCGLTAGKTFTVVVGYIDKNNSGNGKSFRNKKYII
jgi:predicted amidohydrolase